MDSITQAALGAAVGGAYLGPRVGRPALWLGAAVATLPDLDVLVIPLLDPVTQLTAHRTYTHNLLVIALAAPLLGALLARWWPEPGWRRWWLFSALCLFTAVGLDLFTAYGVPLLYPFSDAAGAIASVSVIDPLYTLPLLLALALCRGGRWRCPLIVGLVLSSAYLALTAALKLHVSAVFSAELERQRIPHSRLFTKPTFFNSVLWRAVADGEEAYWVGFYSLFDADQRVSFRPLPKGEALLACLDEAPPARAIRLATGGYVQALAEGESVLLRDVRYGSGTDWLPPEQDRPFVFTYRLTPTADGWQVQALDTRRGSGEESRSLAALWRRLLGER